MKYHSTHTKLANICKLANTKPPLGKTAWHYLQRGAHTFLWLSNPKRNTRTYASGDKLLSSTVFTGKMSINNSIDKYIAVYSGSGLLSSSEKWRNNSHLHQRRWSQINEQNEHVSENIFSILSTYLKVINKQHWMIYCLGMYK